MDSDLKKKIQDLEKQNQMLEKKVNKLHDHILQFISKDDKLEKKINEYKLKLVVLGESSVGKTSFINRFAYKKFESEYLPTIGVEITKMKLRFKNDEIFLIIWDLAGQTAYQNLSKVYLQDADLAILMYDITRSNTFQSIKNWFDVTMKVLENKFVSLLVGNKLDLENQRKVTPKEALKFAQSKNIPFIETSAKDDTNIKDAIIVLIADFLHISLF